PVLNAIGIPKPIASRPAKTRPIPATNITNIIELTPQPRPKRSQAAPPRYRHIVCTANRQLRPGFRTSVIAMQDSGRSNCAVIQVPFSPPAVVLPPTNYCPFVALHQG